MLSLTYVFLAGTSGAATLSVGPTRPYTTIQSAIDVSIPGDVIEVDPGTYQEMLFTDRDLTIVGLGGSSQTFLTTTSSPAVHNDYGALTLRGLDISAGSGPYVINMLDYQLYLDDVRIADSVGVAVHAYGGLIEATGCVFEDNLGGAIDSYWGFVEVTGSAFYGNSGLGAIYIETNLGWENLTVFDSTFIGNEGAVGGAIFTPAGSVHSSLFVGNIGTNGGAISSLQLESTPYYYTGLIVEGSYFEGNSAENGGALYNPSSATDSRFVDNVATGAGGAIYGDTPRIAGSYFQGNAAGGSGGHVFSYLGGYYGVMTATDSLFVDGTAGGDGGAVFGAMTVTSSLFLRNTAGGNGGAVVFDPNFAWYNWQDVVTGSSFLNNDAGDRGGAVFGDGGGGTSLGISQSYFCENTAVDGAGAWINWLGVDKTIRDNVFAANGGDALRFGTYGLALTDQNIVANTFVSNRGNGVSLPTAGGDLMDNIFADHPGTAHEGDVQLVSGNTWWSNGVDSINPAVPALGDTIGDPLFADFSDDGNCYNDDFTALNPTSLGPVSWTDADADGVPEWPVLDNCDAISNPDQLDTDGDGIGDPCDSCPYTPETLPGAGCDPDMDGDGLLNHVDPCPYDAPDDTDGDGVCDSDDVCPGFDDILDQDGDGLPDDCDLACPADPLNDSDADGVCDSSDACLGFDDAVDTDADAVPDGCDPCPTLANVGDGDSDGVCDPFDTCPGFDDQLDTDGDGAPDGCDPCPNAFFDDADLDGVCDDVDLCPGFDDADDADLDGTPDGCDPCPNDALDDSDGDGVCDSDDICPGGNDLSDPDGDGVPGSCDACPLDPLDDSDGDGICDSDDACPGFDDAADADNDAVPDACDNCPMDSNRSQFDEDGDGYGLACDCRDTDASVFEVSVEVCDGLDNDCNGQVDDVDTMKLPRWYQDHDGDGFGEATRFVDACDAPALHAAQGGDCDDDEPTVNPAAPEVCDGVDNDCDGNVDGDTCPVDEESGKGVACASARTSPGSGALMVMVFVAVTLRRRDDAEPVGRV